MKNSVQRYLTVLAVSFVISIPLLIPFLSKGFFPTHDGEWAVVRLSEMYREVRDFQLPARFSGYLNFQYGYPLFEFTYPAPYYAGVALVFLKTGFVNSIKALFFLSVILSAFFMFLLSSSLWRNKLAGFVSAVLYIYAPYRIIDLYVRGSLGESLSFSLFPIVLLGIKKIYDTSSIRSIILTSVPFALLIGTHNIMALLFGIIILFIFITSLITKKIIFAKSLLISVVLSLGLSAFFWLPALFEKNLIALSKTPIADRSLYFVKPLELVIEKWGYGTPTDANGFGYQVGFPHLAIFILAVFFVVKTKNLMGSFLIGTITIFSLLLFSPSAFIWENTPFLSEINYPWIIIGILIFLISLLAGFIIRISKVLTFAALVLCVMAIILYLPHARPSEVLDRGDEFYQTNQATTTSSNELMPLWVNQIPLRSPTKKVEVSKGEIDDLIYSSKNISFLVNSPKNEIIRINTIYYPGWNFFIDNNKTEINYDNKYGVMELKSGGGEQKVRGVFSETPLRIFSDAVSVLSVFLVLILFFKPRATKVKKK